MGLSAVNTKVWVAIIAVFVLALVVHRVRLRWARWRRVLAVAVAARIRDRQHPQGTKRP